MKERIQQIGRIACTAAVFTMASSAFAADKASNFIARAYDDLLGRPAGTAEVNIWRNYVQAGGSRMQFASYLMTSGEYRSRLVDGWYSQFLNRDPNAGELAFAGMMLMNGMSYKEVRATLIGANEYFVKAGGTNDRFIQQVYLDLLGRSPSAGETQFILATLPVRAPAAMQRAQVVTLVQNSGEFWQRQLTSMYQKYLRRNPSPTELASGTQMLMMGVPEEFEIAKMVGSEEYYNLAERR